MNKPSQDWTPNFEPMYDFGYAEKEMSAFVPDQKTPLDSDTAARALSEGYRIVTGSKPDKITLALLLGQVALETGNFKSIHNYNFGNVRGTAPDGKWTSFKAGEIIDGKEVILEAGEKNKFRAYDDPVEGAADFVRVLKSRPHWWAGLQTKTVEGFVKGLSTYPVYFTASPVLYASVLSNRMINYTELAKKYGASGVGIALAAAAAGVGAYFGAKKIREKIT
jgi:hypothetical protein